MKKIIYFIFLFNVLFADITVNKNIKVLEALNISPNFINNPLLQRTYRYYLIYRNKYIINSLENSMEIYPIIKSEIKKSDLPSELISVVMAESYMNVNAKSDKDAVGLWQLIPSTARLYGLQINEYVDERRDIYKSTYAAIKYLEKLHDFFGKWYLAIMAYNAGEARIIEGIVRAKVDKLCNSLGKKCYYSKKIRKYRRIIADYEYYGRRKFYPLYLLYKKLLPIKVGLADLLKVQPGLRIQYIPKQTRNYILKIIAISFLFNQQDYEKFNREELAKKFRNLNYAAVTVPPGTSLYYISHLLGVDYSTLRLHNLQLNYSFTPPYKYHIYIPVDKLHYFYARFNPNNKKYVYIYKVKPGDTLIGIAHRFGVKLKLIYAYNKIGRFLMPGEKLFIPMNCIFIKYRVRRGDSLLALANRFGVSYKRIMRINDLQSSLLRVGQILKIPQNL